MEFLPVLRIVLRSAELLGKAVVECGQSQHGEYFDKEVASRRCVRLIRDLRRIEIENERVNRRVVAERADLAAVSRLNATADKRKKGRSYSLPRAAARSIGYGCGFIERNEAEEEILAKPIDEPTSRAFWSWT